MRACVRACVCVCACVHSHNHMFSQSRHLQFHRHKSRKVQELWWQGLPPGVRGEVWRRAIGNELNISPGGRVRQQPGIDPSPL